MGPINPFFMFNDQTHDAVTRYVEIFPNSRIVGSGKGPDGRMNSATFILDGRTFMAYDGGPHFSFSEGLSLFVSCEDQSEVDALTEKLVDGGKQLPCGWVRDRFGVSWQVVPKVLMELLGGSDPAKVQRVVGAMLQMHKLDVAALEAAAAA